jgi:hypothetical protein
MPSGETWSFANCEELIGHLNFVRNYLCRSAVFRGFEFQNAEIVTFLPFAICFLPHITEFFLQLCEPVLAIREFRDHIANHRARDSSLPDAGFRVHLPARACLSQSRLQPTTRAIWAKSMMKGFADLGDH